MTEAEILGLIRQRGERRGSAYVLTPASVRYSARAEVEAWGVKHRYLWWTYPDREPLRAGDRSTEAPQEPSGWKLIVPASVIDG